MKTLATLLLTAVFSLTATLAFANLDGKEKSGSNQETTVSNAPTPAPTPTPAPSGGGCGCGKPKTN